MTSIVITFSKVFDKVSQRRNAAVVFASKRYNTAVATFHKHESFYENYSMIAQEKNTNLKQLGTLAASHLWTNLSKTFEKVLMIIVIVNIPKQRHFRRFTGMCIVTYFGTSTNCKMNFSALPNFDLSPSNDFNISISSISGRIFIRPFSFSAPKSSCSPSKII